MQLLFVHQNFPGQYIHIARHAATLGGHVVAIAQRCRGHLPQIRTISYRADIARDSVPRHLAEFDAAVANGLEVARHCEMLKRGGFTPDLVIGHNGWGEILYLKDVWPTVPLLGYFEFFYRPTGTDVDFDRDFVPSTDELMHLRTRNAVNLLGLDAADWGQTPTEWQREQYPRCYHNQISVVHEGIDTELIRRNGTARVWLKNGLCLSSEDEVITYCARNLEPYRGFHVVMRALPEILRRRPQAHVLVVGGDGVSYGRRPKDARNWRQQLLQELGERLDLGRVHFLGHLPYHHYLAILQVSTVHIYLTYPFVLSWSLLEAMAAECVVVGSRTPPVEEVVSDAENGYLVDFFDVDGIADRVAFACEWRDRHRPIRRAARATVIKRFDLRSICLPAYLRLIHRLGGGRLL